MLIRGKLIKPAIDRVFERLVYDYGCWTWIGALLDNGYGVIGRRPADPGSRLVHRIVYEHEIGSIPARMQIDHMCRNRACCNPSHFDVVSNRENTLRGIANERRADELSARTHCKRGHALPPASKRCVECDRASRRLAARNWRAKQRQSAV